MKFIIFTLVIFCTQNTFAQLPYTDFVQADTAIQWAAEYDQILNITPKIARFGIRNIMHAKLMKGDCIDNYTTNEDGAFKTSFCLRDTGLNNNIFWSNLNPYKVYFYDNRNLSSVCNSSEIAISYLENLNKNKYQIYKVKQILFYKNNKLFINNTLVTPIYLNQFLDSNELQFSWTPSFTGCLNTKNEEVLLREKKLKCIDLGESYAMYKILDHGIEKSGLKIFTKLHPILSHHLFQDILDKKITIVDERENRINNNKVFEVNNPPMEIPIYDGGDGRMVKPTIRKNEVNVESFYLFEIKQHFYFDTISNILYSEVNHIDVYKRIITSAGIDLGYGFHFRIYFVKPSQYKKRPQKRYLNFRES
jgi:hypothetical protein